MFKQITRSTNDEMIIKNIRLQSIRLTTGLTLKDVLVDITSQVITDDKADPKRLNRLTN